MKTFFAVAALFAMACCAHADAGFIPLFADNVTTSTTADTASSEILRGCVERVYIDANVSTNDYTVIAGIAISNTYSGETRTLVVTNLLGMATNLSVYPRALMVDTASASITNAYDKIELYDDVLILSVSEASETNRNVRAYIYYTR